MKSDFELEQEVKKELALNSTLNSTNIRVVVTDGVIQLYGSVTTYAEKKTAEGAAKRVEGCVLLVMDLDLSKRPMLW